MDLGYLILDIGILEGRVNLECFRILLYIIVFSTFLLWIKKSFFFFLKFINIYNIFNKSGKR